MNSASYLEITLKPELAVICIKIEVIIKYFSLPKWLPLCFVHTRISRIVCRSKSKTNTFPILSSNQKS